jgi:hypothetical protein
MGQILIHKGAKKMDFHTKSDTLQLVNTMKTKFASKVIMFEKCLQFKDTITLCYGRQKVVAL